MDRSDKKLDDYQDMLKTESHHDDDYDYADDTGSNGLAGTASSYEDAIEQIRAINQP